MYKKSAGEGKCQEDPRCIAVKISNKAPLTHPMNNWELNKTIRKPDYFKAYKGNL